MSLEDWDHPVLNRNLLDAVNDAIAGTGEAYEGRAKSFAVILNDLEVLAAQLQTKMNFETKTDTAAQVSGGGKRQSPSDSSELEKKCVYVRLFHREMSSIALPHASKSWVKPLFESIRLAEKHGLAIYATEEEVKRSLKGEGYGYATLSIAIEKDISAKRPPKHDPALNCPLLTVADIEIDDLVKFTYNNVDYPVENGILHLPTDDE